MSGTVDWRFTYGELDKIHDFIMKAQRDCPRIASQSFLTSAKTRVEDLTNKITITSSYTKNYKPKYFDEQLKMHRYSPYALHKTVEKRGIPALGSTNVRRELLIISNLITSLLYGLEEERSIPDLKPTFDRASQAIKNLASVVIAEVNDKTLENFLEERPPEHPDEALVASVKKFRNMPDAMKEVAEQISKLQTQENSDERVNKDIVHMARILQNNNRDLLKMQTHIKNAGLNEDAPYTLVKGPVITDSHMDEMKLRGSNVDFDTVYFPGITLGTGFQKHEAVPRMYVLRDQILIAIQTKFGIGEPKKFALKLNKRTLGKTMKQDDLKFEELRGDIVQLLSQKLNIPLVDVTREREGTNYISSPKFPGIRFIWIVKKSIYTKLGSFTSGSQVGLPF